MAKSKLLPIVHVGHSLVVTRSEAWAWVKLPHTNTFMKSVAEHESVAQSIATALRSTLTENDAAVEFHVRNVNRAFDVQGWYDQFVERSQRFNPPPAARVFAEQAALRLEETNQFNLLSETYLGVCLGTREGSSPMGAFRQAVSGLLGRAADKTAGHDLGVPENELKHWMDLSRKLQFTIANAMSGSTTVSADQLTVPAAELIWLLRKPFFPTYGCPDVDIPAGDPDFNGDSIFELTPSDITPQPRHLEVRYGNPVTGVDEEFVSAVCCLSEFSRYSHWPQSLGWAQLVQDRNPNVEWSIRGRVVPASTMKGIVKKNTNTVNRELDDAAKSQMDPGRRLLEQAMESSELEHMISQSSEPWIEASYRLQLRGTDTTELEQNIKNLQTALLQANMRLQRPPHDQLPLLMEFVPGTPWREDLYKRVQSYHMVGAGGLTASYKVGDSEVLGPYLGRVMYGDTPPVFFDPNRAIALNNAPVVSVTGTPGTGKRLWTETPIPGPDGWTTMGDIEVGTRVFDEQGAPCRVTHVTPIEVAPRSFRVTFSDGSVIYADGDHRWVTSTRKVVESRAQGQKLERMWKHPEYARALLAALADCDPEDSLTTAALVSRVVGGPPKDVYDKAAADLRRCGISPTFVPVSLDGSQVYAQVWNAQTIIARTLESMILRHPQTTSRSDFAPMVRTTDEIRATLRTPTGLPNHAIAVTKPLTRDPFTPGRGGRTLDTREAQLRSLVSEHGVRSGNRITLTMPDDHEAEIARGLACSLGHVATIGGQPFEVTWIEGERYRFVVSVEPVDPLPMRCITVNSQSHQYLAGDSLIPTHNTFLALSLAYQCAARGYHTMYIDPKADAVPFAELPGLGNVTLFNLQEGADGMLDPFRMGDDLDTAGLLALEVLGDLTGGVNDVRESALTNAINYVKVRPNPSLWAVVERMASFDEGTPEYNLAALFSTMRKVAFGRLLFAPELTGQTLRATDGLTVVTLLGLDTPGANTPPEEYTYEQRIGSAVMYLLTKYAYSLMAQGDPNYPKALFVDEAWSVLGTTAGRRMVENIARMGRSRNTSLTLISQNVTDFSETTIGNQVAARFVFGSTDASEHARMLKYLDLAETEENLLTVAALTRQDWRGRCLVKDPLGRVGLIQVDPYRQDLFEAFNTNPETRKARPGRA